MIKTVIVEEYWKVIAKWIGVLLVLFILIAGAFTNTTEAAGKTLFSCNFDGSGNTAQEVWKNCGGNASSNVNSSLSIVSDGISGKAIKKTAPNWAILESPDINKNPITITYYEKFSTWPIKNANVKSIRQFYGSGSGDYMAAIMSAHFDTAWYQSYWKDAKFVPGSKINWVQTGGDYCSKNNDGSYDCPNRVRFTWKSGFGTSWHKIRVFINMPSSDSASDGEVKVWMDEDLFYTLTNIKKESGGSNITKYITWYPSDEASQNYDHYYDEINVYSGYVGPNGETSDTDSNSGKSSSASNTDNSSSSNSNSNSNNSSGNSGSSNSNSSGSNSGSGDSKNNKPPQVKNLPSPPKKPDLGSFPNKPPKPPPVTPILSRKTYEPLG